MTNINSELHIVSLVCANVKEESGLSVREIARRMGTPGHQAQVERIIDEKHAHNMTLKTLFKFAEACGYECNISFKKKPTLQCTPNCKPIGNAGFVAHSIACPVVRDKEEQPHTSKKKEK